MDRNEVCSRFIETLTFDLYPFQEEALLAWFESAGGVMVCAPTGMGKTLIAEAAVFEALHLRRRMYYTTPLIALTDQKFREMQDLAERWGFDRRDIGLITGNRRENPDAIVRVVVAEILLNHLLSPDPAVSQMEDVHAVVMDEFHNFNDPERGPVWELSLVLLPRSVRVMLLSATVGNPVEFAGWLRREHGRDIRVILSQERRVPLEYVWVGDKLLTEQLPSMIADDDAASRVPALVFCFNRDECWDVAEVLKGLSLVRPAARAQIEAYLDERRSDFAEGVGPKLRQMLLRGVGVHHAGVLPKHKEVVEELFLRKLVPFVICTETLAAGINLPARSVVLSTLLKGKRGEKKLISPAVAHQIFGRAGRPQFDRQGYVFVLAPEDDVKIAKWTKKYEQLDPRSKNPGILRARKELERRKPTRRKTEQYWHEGQLRMLIEAGPARLLSRSMISYPVLVYLLTKTGTLRDVRAFLARRFNDAAHIARFQEQLNYMIANLAALGYLTVPGADLKPPVIAPEGTVPAGPEIAPSRTPDVSGPAAANGLSLAAQAVGRADRVILNETIAKLLVFRSVDPLYGAFLSEQLVRSSFEEKILALESVLEIPPVIERRVRIPEMEPGPLQRDVLAPLMIRMGVTIARAAGPAEEEEDAEEPGYWDEPQEEERPPTFPEMLRIVFESRLAAPEPVFVQPKWVGGGVLEAGGHFYRFVASRNLVKQEGIVLRHLLRLVILAGEFFERTEDPDYERLGHLMTRVCQDVDPRYTDRFLEQAQAVRELAPVAP